MVQIVFEPTRSRAAAYDDGKQIGCCDIAQAGGRWTITHTEVDPAYGGQGIAKKLVLCVQAQAQQEQAALASTCSYATKVLGL